MDGLLKLAVSLRKCSREKRWSKENVSRCTKTEPVIAAAAARTATRTSQGRVLYNSNSLDVGLVSDVLTERL